MKPLFYLSSIIILFISASPVDKSEQKRINDTKYESVIIHDQEWMVMNLDIDHFKSGDPILHAKTRMSG